MSQAIGAVEVPSLSNPSSTVYRSENAGPDRLERVHDSIGRGVRMLGTVAVEVGRWGRDELAPALAAAARHVQERAPLFVPETVVPAAEAIAQHVTGIRDRTLQTGQQVGEELRVWGGNTAQPVVDDISRYATRQAGRARDFAHDSLLPAYEAGYDRVYDGALGLADTALNSMALAIKRRQAKRAARV